MIRYNENSEQLLLQLRLQNGHENIFAIVIDFQYLHIYAKNGKLSLYNSLTYLICLMKQYCNCFIYYFTFYFS